MNGDFIADIERHEIFAEFLRSLIVDTGLFGYLGGSRFWNPWSAQQYEMCIDRQLGIYPGEHRACLLRGSVMIEDATKLFGMCYSASVAAPIS